MFVAPNFALEQSICNYLNNQLSVNGSLLSGSTVTFYTGIGNAEDLTAPAVVVDASDTREVEFNSRNYEFHTKIIVKEMAADTTQLGSLAGAVFNEFANSKSASINLTNPVFNMSVWQVRIDGFQTETSGDALYNTGNFIIVGAMTP